MTADELAEAVVEKFVIPHGLRRVLDGAGDGSFAFSCAAPDGRRTYWWENAEKLLLGNEYGFSVFSLIDPYEPYDEASSLEELEILLAARGLI